jgi:hypothetical protein
MTHTETDTATETEQPAQLPECTQAVLRAMLDAGGTAFVADEDCIVAGTREKPGQVLPCDAAQALLIASMMLIAGERERLLTTRRGRHFARAGTMAGFDDSVTDVDLAAFGRGSIDYMSDELIEAVEAYHHEIVLTREDALALLLRKGVIPPAEARTE